MNFTLTSIFPWIAFVVPLGFLGGLIGGIVSGIGSIFGGKKKTTSTTPSNFAQQFNNFKREITDQMNIQAQESKKTMTMVLAGAGFLIVIMFFFLKK